MKKEKPAKLAVGKKAVPAPAPPQRIICRLPKNYEWTGNGYIIR